MTRTSEATETKTGRKPAGMDEMEQLIPLEDDCMFSAVMRNKDACIGFLEALFGGRRVKDIEYVDPPQTQRFVSVLPDGKSIRLDVYFEDSDAVYDIELQRMNQRDLSRRARLYSSYMDAGALTKGMDYGDMKDSYVIFVCKFDPFGKGRKVYTYRMLCEEDASLPLEDGRHIIFVNTKGTVGGAGPELDALASYMNGGASSIGVETGSPYVDRLDGYVRRLNMDEGWRREHMKYELNLMDKYKEGVAEEKRRIAKEMHSKGIAEDVIASCTSLDRSEVERIIKG